METAELWFVTLAVCDSKPADDGPDPTRGSGLTAGRYGAAPISYISIRFIIYTVRGGP